eukprot:3616683-Amphidinium_carterae.1
MRFLSADHVHMQQQQAAAASSADNASRAPQFPPPSQVSREYDGLRDSGKTVLPLENLVSQPTLGIHRADVTPPA